MQTEIPNNWQVVKLCTIAKLIGGGTPPKQKSTYYDGNILWATVRDMNVDLIEDTDVKITQSGLQNSSSKIVPKGNIIIATRVGVGKVCRNKFDTAINQDLRGICPNNGTDIQYLFYFLKSISNYLQSISTGATVKGIRVEQVEELKVPLPSLQEQRRIVTKLDSLFERTDRAIELVEYNITDAQHLMASALNEMANSLVNEFGTDRFEKYLTLSRGHNPPKSKFIYTPREGYVRFIQIRDGSSDLNAVYVPESKQLKMVSKDDLLLVAYRQVGKVFRGMEGAFNVALCKIVNSSPTIINTDFVYYLIQTYLVKGELLKRSERALIPSMSVDHLASLQIPIPPLKIQERVVDYLEHLNKIQTILLAKQKQRLNELKALKSSLLNAAFNGEL